MDKPVVAQNKPYILEVEPGDYYWCSCGRSSTQPFCDGSHKETGFEPVKVTITEQKQISWCGCKHSFANYRCDGTHGKFL